MTYPAIRKRHVYHRPYTGKPPILDTMHTALIHAEDYSEFVAMSSGRDYRAVIAGWYTCQVFCYNMKCQIFVY